jgi:hypothetical protein
MNLTALLRPPLVWIALVEAMLIGILGLVAWHVWQQRVAPVAAAVAPLVSAPRPDPGAARPALPDPSSAPPGEGAPRPGPTPGVRTDASFLSRELAELNQVEATFENLEWRVTSAIADAIQRYVTGVVLPSIDRTERGQR